MELVIALLLNGMLSLIQSQYKVNNNIAAGDMGMTDNSKVVNFGKGCINTLGWVYVTWHWDSFE